MTTTRVKWLRVTIRVTSQKKPNDAEVYELRIKNAIKEEQFFYAASPLNGKFVLWKHLAVIVPISVSLCFFHLGYFLERPVGTTLPSESPKIIEGKRKKTYRIEHGLKMQIQSGVGHA